MSISQILLALFLIIFGIVFGFGLSFDYARPIIGLIAIAAGVFIFAKK